MLVGLALLATRDAAAECAEAGGGAPGDATVALVAVTLVNVGREASGEILDTLAARLTESFEVDVAVAPTIEDPGCVGDAACACRIASDLDAYAVVFVVLTRLGDVLRIDAVTNDPRAGRSWEHPAVELAAERVDEITKDQMDALLTQHSVRARAESEPATMPTETRRRRGWLAVGAGLTSLGAGAALALSAGRTDEVRRGRAADAFLAAGAVSGAVAAVLLWRDRRARKTRPRVGVRGRGGGGVVTFGWSF